MRFRLLPQSTTFDDLEGSLRTCFQTEYVMTLQGHPRSLIVATIESAYASYRLSIVTLVLPCPVSEILLVSGEEPPHPYSSRILGVFPLD